MFTTFEPLGLYPVALHQQYCPFPIGGVPCCGYVPDTVLHPPTRHAQIALSIRVFVIHYM